MKAKYFGQTKPVGIRRAVRSCTRVECAVKARWAIDARYGRKQQALSLMKQWVEGVGRKAGISPGSATLCSGAVGAPESRIELEVVFQSLGELESFWGRIPTEEHEQWSKQVASCIVDGSPTWTTYYTIPLDSESSANDASDEETITSSGLILPSEKPKVEIKSADDFTSLLQGALGDQEKGGVEELPTINAKEENDQNSSSQDPKERRGEKHVPLDWKGDPMNINPGDKLPFKF